MPFLCVGLAHAQSQSQLPVQFGVRKKKIAASIQAVHNRLIRRVSGFVPEAN